MTTIRAALLFVIPSCISISAPTFTMHVSAKVGATGHYASITGGYKFDWAVGAFRHA